MEGNFFIPVDLFTKTNSPFLWEAAPGAIDKDVSVALESHESPDTKFKLFQNALFRYLQFQDKVKRPVEGRLNLSEYRLDQLPTPPTDQSLPSIPDNLDQRLAALKADQRPEETDPPLEDFEERLKRLISPSNRPPNGQKPTDQEPHSGPSDLGSPERPTNGGQPELKAHQPLEPKTHQSKPEDQGRWKPMTEYSVDFKDIPRSKLDSAKALWDHVKTIDELKVDNEGKINYKGKIHEKSNINRLISDYTKSTTRSTGPGGDILASALRDSNVDSTIIGNRARLGEIWSPGRRRPIGWKPY